MPVTATYRAHIVVPEDLWQAIASAHIEARFDASMSRAQAGHIAAGTDWYSERVEWADYHTRKQADTAESNMLAVIGKYRHWSLTGEMP